MADDQLLDERERGVLRWRSRRGLVENDLFIEQFFAAHGNDLTRAQVLAAVRAIPPGQDYVWDGLDEDDRPASDAELQAGLQAALKKRGRPTGSGSKEQVAIRIDRDVLAAFRAGGAGWQTRMNDALRDWLRSHSAV